MKSLGIIAMCCLAIVLLAMGEAGAVTYTATVTATVTTASTITVSPATIAFGSIAATSTNYRSKSPVATVTILPAGSYEIRVYTDNGVGSVTTSTDPKVRGFIRNAATTGAGRLYPKIWSPNFSANIFISDTLGPTLSTTSSQTDYLWKGKSLDGDDTLDETLTSGTYSEATLGQDINGNGNITGSYTATTDDPIYEGASLSWIREEETFFGIAGREDDTVDNARSWRCVLCWNTTGRGDGSLDNPFPIAFYVDLMGVPAGIYTSENNTVAVGGGTPTKGVFFDLKIY